MDERETPRGAEEDPLRVVMDEISALGRLLVDYLRTYRVSARALRRTFIVRVLTFMSLGILTLALAIYAVTLSVSGFSGALASGFQVPRWSADLIVGAVLLLLIGGGTYLFYRASKKNGLLLLDQREVARKKFLTELKASPSHLEPIFSLNSWAEHHPWMTVGVAAKAGDSLAAVFFGDEKEPPESPELEEKSEPRTPHSKQLYITLFQEGLILVSALIRQVLPLLVNPQVTKQNFSKSSSEHGEPNGHASSNGPDILH